MGLLIDASVLIEHERGRLDLDRHLEGRAEEDFFVSVVTASELLHGVHRAESASQRNRRSAWVEGILDRFPLLSIDLPTARAHARLWAELAGEGRIIGPQDLWLAAACLAHGERSVSDRSGPFATGAVDPEPEWFCGHPPYELNRPSAAGPPPCRGDS